MQAVDLAQLMREAMLVTLKLAGPPLGVGLGLGLVVSLLQAVTQIHEQTLAFVPKILGLGATLALLGAFMLGVLSDFTRTLFDQLIVVGAS
jgi:flagellar biosynthetic protein FliQ